MPSSCIADLVSNDVSDYDNIIYAECPARTAVVLFMVLRRIVDFRFFWRALAHTVDACVRAQWVFRMSNLIGLK